MLTRGSSFYLYLKLVQINFIFALNVHKRAINYMKNNLPVISHHRHCFQEGYFTLFNNFKNGSDHIIVKYLLYSRGGRTQRMPPPPLKIGKNMICLPKIVIFHTKCPKHFRTSLCSARFF